MLEFKLPFKELFIMTSTNSDKNKHGVKIIKNSPIILILIGLFLIGCFSSLQAQRKTKKTFTLTPVKKGLIRYCLRYRSLLYEEFLSEGILYQKKLQTTKDSKSTPIANVKYGCFVIKKSLCRSLDTVAFRPSKLRGFRYIYYFSIPKRNGACYFKSPFINELNMDYKAFQEMKNLYISIPYVKNIVLNEPVLRRQITPKVANCNSFAGRDKVTCQISETYNYLVSNYKYIPDQYASQAAFKKGDLIYTPRQTIKQGGGDCEDLTGLLLSYLINQNIESYLILTDKHAYGMACGVDSKLLQKLVHNKFDTVEVQEKTVVLQPGQIFTLRLSAQRNLPIKIKAQMQSTGLVNLYRLSSYREVKKIQYQQDLEYEKDCSKLNTKKALVKCKSSLFSLTAIEALPKNDKPVKVKIKISYYYNTINLQNNLKIRYYLVNNKKCVVLEPTAGKDGYPGFSVETSKRKLAINPKNGNWFYLQ